jgi:hypothetical protein
MKDQNAPKRPLTGFFRFAQSIRAQVQAETGLKGIAVTPVLTQRWKELSEEEKNVYNSQFHEEMVQWKQQYQAYKETDSYKEFQAKKKAKKLKAKKPKDKNAPKRPCSAYILFSMDARDQVRSEMGADASFGQIGAKISQMWNELNDDNKQYYQAKAGAAKAQYAQTLAEYRQSAAYAEFQERVGQFKDSVKAMKKATKEATKAAKKVQKKKIMKKKK